MKQEQGFEQGDMNDPTKNVTSVQLANCCCSAFKVETKRRVSVIVEPSHRRSNSYQHYFLMEDTICAVAHLAVICLS